MKRTEGMTVRFTKEELKQLWTEAKKHDCKRAQLIRVALRHYFLSKGEAWPTRNI